MPWIDVLWDDEPGGNVEHVAEHGLTRDDVNNALRSPEAAGVSRRSGRPMVYGRTLDGRRIMVVYIWIDEITVQPITAYELEG